ncbi:hypothetical protein LguiA_030217 [Lonicera macranthoides]
MRGSKQFIVTAYHFIFNLQLCCAIVSIHSLISCITIGVIQRKSQGVTIVEIRGKSNLAFRTGGEVKSPYTFTVYHIFHLNAGLDILGRLLLPGCILVHVEQSFIVACCRVCRFGRIPIPRTFSCPWDQDGVGLYSSGIQPRVQEAQSGCQKARSGSLKDRSVCSKPVPCTKSIYRLADVPHRKQKMDYLVPKLGVEVASEELPTSGPASLAIYCYMRLAGVPFELSYEAHSSGAVPYVEYGTYTVFDKENLIERLKEDNIVNLDYHCKSPLDILRWNKSIKLLEEAHRQEVNDTSLPQACDFTHFNYDADEVHGVYSTLGSLLGNKPFFYGDRQVNLYGIILVHVLILSHIENVKDLIIYLQAHEFRCVLFGARIIRSIRFAGSTAIVYSGHVIGYGEESTYGMRVAIKWPQKYRKRSERTEMERELRYLREHQHPNIVKLLGFAEDNGYMYLVYEYMKRTSVIKNFEDLDWEKTKKIALGCATAMQYLHTRTPPLIFRDFRLANILLDEEFNPKLCDFGGVTAEGEVLCAGTLGSTDRALLISGVGKKDLDIYGMGTLLMHLLKQYVPHGAQQPIDKTVQKEVEGGQYIVHEKLQTSGCSVHKATLMIKLALSCVNPDAKTRPTIQEVLQKLHDIDLE